MRHFSLRGVGRPSRARRREPDEPNSKQKKRKRGNQTLKLKRQQTTVKCKICGTPGHNAATCPNKQASQHDNLENLLVQMDSTVTEDEFGEENALERVKKMIVSSTYLFL